MNVHNQNQILNQHISKLQTELILIDHGLCPDWSRESHTRQRDSVYLILDGKGEITINGEKFFPVKNNLVLLPKGSVVSFHSETETCYNKYWCEFLMHFDGVSLFNVIDFPYVIEVSDMAYAKSLFDRLDALHLNTDVASALRLKATLLEIIAIFLQNDVHREKKIKDDPFVNRMKDFIHKNIDKDLSVSVLSTEMSFNEKYFISLFKNHFGSTPSNYIKTVRMEKAKNELLYTDHKSLYIINQIGYSSIQKFSKDFKAYTGFSPTEFRKKFK